LRRAEFSFPYEELLTLVTSFSKVTQITIAGLTVVGAWCPRDG
jgi:hypothetical protein